MAEGQLMPIKEIYDQWAARISTMMYGLEAFENRLSPILEMKPRSEVAKILKAEVRRLRKSYSETGRYCPDIEEREK